MWKPYVIIQSITWVKSCSIFASDCIDFPITAEYGRGKLFTNKDFEYELGILVHEAFGNGWTIPDPGFLPLRKGERVQ